MELETLTTIAFIGIPITAAIFGAIGFFWKKAYSAGSDDAITDGRFTTLHKCITSVDEKVDELGKEMATHIEDDKINFASVHKEIEDVMAKETAKAAKLHDIIFKELKENNRIIGEIKGAVDIIKERKN